MKISIIYSNNIYTQSNASSNRLRSLVDGLIKYDIKIRFIIIGNDCKNENIITINSNKFIDKITFKYILNIKQNTITQRRLYYYIIRPFLTFFIINRIIKEINKDKECIVWTNNELIGYKAAYKIRKNNKEIKIFTEISEYLDIYKYNKGNILHKYIGWKTEKYFIKKAFEIYSGISLMTKTLYNYFNTLPANDENKPKMLQLPMTVDLKRFDDNKEQPKDYQKPYIVYVGVMNDAKDGVNTLLKSYLELTKQFSEYKLYLIGGWNYDTPAHLEFIKQNELENKAYWMGEVNRDIIPSILKNAELLVLPRPDSKQARGGFPTKLGEYLASGVPVCATTVGEIPNYLKDNESVFFAEPGSVISFSKAMIRALSNKENAKRVGENGRKAAEKYFNKDTQAETLFKFLQTL